MITRPGLKIHAQRKTHGRLLHSASNYISVREVSEAANGSSIADYVYTCIGRLGGTEHGVWTDQFHADIEAGIFRCPQVFTGDYHAKT
jgi:hypothetical protein